MSDNEQTEPVVFKPKAMGVKKKGAEKIRQVAENTDHIGEERLRKPRWIRAQFPGGEEVQRMKALMREQKLHSVCEEASCPNIGECFRHSTASFMIMGDICTRRCPFCDVGHGRPNPLDAMEPIHLAETVRNLGLHHVVITSVDRDDLLDGGAAHFAACAGNPAALSCCGESTRLTRRMNAKWNES